MDSEVLVYYIPRAAAVPPSAITGADWTAMDARVDTLEAGHTLDSHTDVNTAGAADGDRLVYDSATSTWVPEATASGISAVQNNAVDLMTDVLKLNAEVGIEFYDAGVTPGTAAMRVKFAGTGSASTVARSDHSHSAQIGRTWSFAATGVLSSGTRTLMSQTITLAAGITYDITATAKARVRNNVNSGTINLLFRVGTDAGWPEISRNVQNVGGVPVDQDIDFRNQTTGEHLTLVGTGAAIDVSFKVQYSSGDASDIRDGYVTVVARPRR